MNTSCRIIGVCCLALLWAGGTAPRATANEVVLHADFDLDSVGQPPTSDLPGDPEGDSISLSTAGGPITVRAEVGDLTDQPLHLDRQEGYRKTFGFRADTADHEPCDLYEASWRSLVRQQPGLFAFTFRAHSPPGSSAIPLLAALEYRDGGLLTFSGSGRQLSVAYATDVAQLFEVELDMAEGTASLWIDGAAVAEAQDVAFVQGGTTNLRRFSGEPGLIDTYQLAVDDIHVECVPEPSSAPATLAASFALGACSSWRSARRAGPRHRARVRRMGQLGFEALRARARRSSTTVPSAARPMAPGAGSGTNVMASSQAVSEPRETVESLP